MIKQGPIYTVAIQIHGEGGELECKDVGVVGADDAFAAAKVALSCFTGGKVVSVIQSIQDVMVIE